MLPRKHSVLDLTLIEPVKFLQAFCEKLSSHHSLAIKINGKPISQERFINLIDVDGLEGIRNLYVCTENQCVLHFHDSYHDCFADPCVESIVSMLSKYGLAEYHRSVLELSLLSRVFGSHLPGVNRGPDSQKDHKD